MNTATNRTEDVERYVEAVRAHLRDLPAADVSELLEDLRQHLAEIASEEASPLTEQLGPPEAYAEELRTSAGLPTSADATAGRARQRVAAIAARLAEDADRLGAHPWVRQLRAPGVAWWLCRGYAIALAIGLVTSWTGALDVLPFVVVGRSPVVGMLVTVLTMAVSVSAGRRAQFHARPGLDRLCTLMLVLLLFPATATVRAMTEQGHYEDIGPGVPEGALARPDGSMITNVYPYGPDGRPLEDVLLYDQDGRPVELTPVNSAEGLPLVTSYPLDRDGRPVMHAYPQRQAFRDPDGGPAYQHGPYRPSPDVRTLTAEETPSAEPSPAAPTESAPDQAPSGN